MVCGAIVVIVGLACIGYAQILAAVTVVPAFETERHLRVALFRRWGALAIVPGVALLLLGLWRSRRAV
jgi:hypothetical protein